MKNAYFHRLVAPALVAALTAIWLHARLEVKKVVGYDFAATKYDTLTAEWLNERGLLDFDGTYNYRLIRGGNQVSLHGIGIAIDLAAAKNALGQEETTLPDWFIQCFRDHGFFWGGDFVNRKDNMHFQYARNC